MAYVLRLSGPGRRHKVAVFISNYTLYGDISSLVTP